MSLIDDQAMHWVLERAEGAPDGAREQAFQDWYEADVRHKGAYVRALCVHNAVSRATVQDNLRRTGAATALALPDEDDGDDADDAHPPLGAAEPSHDPWRAPARPHLRRLIAFGAVAACVAVLGTRAWLPPQQQQGGAALVLATARGEFRSVPLADHSIAAINSASRIEVRYSERARTVSLLAGEAWFQVAKDKSRPFTVSAGPLHAQAVGTAFALRRHEDGAEVMVTEGTVAVWTGAGGQRRMLGAGERAVLGNGGRTLTVERGGEEVQRRLAWREGKLVFMNQTLKEAVADFNRYSAKPIVIADARLESKPLIGQYRIDAPERFARDVCTSLKVPFTITATQIVIGASS